MQEENEKLVNQEATESKPRRPSRSVLAIDEGPILFESNEGSTHDGGKIISRK